MRDLDHIDVKVIVSEHGAADRCDADGSASYAQLVYCLGNEPMNDAVSAAGAVMCGPVLEGRCSLKNGFHIGCFLRRRLFFGIEHCRIFLRISSTVGTPPAGRP
jgi:hypothetical protein